MPGAKIGLVEYITRNPFAKIKQISSYGAYIKVATTSTLRKFFKHLIKRKPQTLRKLNRILKSNSALLQSTRWIASQSTYLVNDNSQIQIKAMASHSNS